MVRRRASLTLAVLVLTQTVLVPALPARADPPLPPGASRAAPKQQMGSAADRRPNPKPEEPAGPTTLPDPYKIAHEPGAVGPERRYPVPRLPGPTVQAAPLELKQPATPSGFVAGQSRELTNERTPRSTAFLNPDGSRTMRFYDDQVHVVGARGEYVRTDYTLNRAADGRLRPRAAAAVSIGARATDRNLVLLDLGNRTSVGFALDGANPVDATVGDDGATFQGARHAASLRLRPTVTGLKEEIVLDSADAATSWTFPLHLTGVRPRNEKDGTIAFVDGRGAVKAVIPPGFMVDSNVDPRTGEGARSDAVNYELLRKGSGWALRVDIDENWLRDKARKFPVTVDPTFRVDADRDDTYVSSRDRANRDNSHEGDLLVGTYNGGAEKSASYLQFRHGFNVLRNKFILGASLNLWNYWSYSCQARPVTLYRVTQPWEGSGTRRWPGPAYDAANPIAERSFAHGYYNCPNGAWEGFQIDAQRLTNWVHGVEPFHGFALRASDGDSFGWKRFASANYGTANSVPFLDVNYSDQGAAYSLPDAVFDPPVTAGTAGSITVRVTNWGSATWSPTNGYRFAFHLVDSSGRVVQERLVPVPRETGPSRSVDIPIEVGPAPGLGDFTLKFDMVDPGGRWFGPTYSSPVGTIPFKVENGPPHITGVYPPNNGHADSLTPTLWAGVHDRDNYPPGKREVNFRLCQGTPEEPTDCVSSGWRAENRWTVPEGLLKWGQTAFWWVQPTDTLTPGQEAGPIAITPIVPQPEVTSHLAGAPSGADIPGVNPQVGNFSEPVVDVTVNVAGPALEVVRTYNSQDLRTTGAFGTGWSTPFDQRLTVDTDGSRNVVLTLASGRTVRFGRYPDGTYASPSGVNLDLVRRPATQQDPEHWVLRDPSGSRRQFNSMGRLVQVTDANGRAQSYSYDGNGHLSTVVDTTSGRTLRLTWTGSHVTSIATDPANPGDPPPTWTYTYSGDLLDKVCSPLSAQSCVRYRYTGGSHYRSVVSDDNPTGYWPLGEASGTKAVNVAARKPGEHDGLLSEATLGQPGALAGSSDTAAKFTGAVGGGLTLPQDLLNNSAGLAVELWFKVGAGKAGVLAQRQDAPLGGPQNGSTTPLLYVGTDGRLRGGFPRSGGNSVVMAGPRVDDGQWHHVVLSGAVTRQDMYLDGVSVGSVSSYDIAVGGSHNIVGNGWVHETKPDLGLRQGWFAFDGLVDEVAYYGRPLGALQVGAHWSARAATTRLTGVTEPGDFAAVQIGYDQVTGGLASLTDRHGATWTVSTPTLGKDIFERNTRNVVINSTVRSAVTYTYESDRGNRLITRTDAFGPRFWFYNEAGFVVSVLDETRRFTKFDTDARGNVLGIFPGCNSPTGCKGERFRYFLNSNDVLDPRNDALIWRADARSASPTDTTYRTTYTIDGVGRPIKVTYPRPAGATVNPTEIYTYSTGDEPAEGGGRVPPGLLMSSTARNKAVTRYFYDSQGDLVRTADAVGLISTYGHDQLGRRKSLANKGGQAVEVACAGR